MAEGSEFHVKLDGIKLPEAEEARIASEVQATVIRELGRIKLAGDIQIRVPKKEWLGLWAEKYKGTAVLPTPAFIEGK